MKKTVAIIGAGVSGLTAGIYALQTGYETTIYEKNPMPGGECTVWTRDGYHIDNCIHFLIGCNKEDALNKIWENTGALSNDVSLYREPSFYSLEMEGKQLHLWRDLEKTRAELLAIAPEDEKELLLFFECVKNCECIKPPCDISPAHMNPIQYIKMGMSMKNASRANKEYGKQTMSEFVERFKNPYIRALFGNYFNSNFLALTYVTSYAFYTSDTVAIPEGGSQGMTARMRKRFEELGGDLRLSSEIEDINISNGKISSAVLETGEIIAADDYIWAADPYHLFYKMIGTEHIDPNLKYMYENPDGYCANTGYQAAFGINSDEDLNLPEGSVIFPCEKYIVSGEEHDFCGMRVYNYDKSLYPKDKRVIQCNILQNAKNYDRWEDLYKDRPAYEAEKQRIAEELRVRVEKQYPQLEGKLVLLSTYSPITFTKWCNAYKGGYMSFNALKGYKSKYIKSTVKGVSNLFLASQWLQNGGGLPIAAAGGKFAVDAMVKNKGH